MVTQVQIAAPGVCGGKGDGRGIGNILYLEPDAAIIATALVTFKGWAPGRAEWRLWWQRTVTAAAAASSFVMIPVAELEKVV